MVLDRKLALTYTKDTYSDCTNYAHARSDGGDYSEFFELCDLHIMNICIGQSRKRITLQSTRFYTQGELFKLTRDQSRNSTVWLEYGPNLYQPIKTDHELRFTCQMMEGEIDSYMPQEDREQNNRDVADAIHTHNYEMSIRVRRPRSHPTEGAKHRS